MSVRSEFYLLCTTYLTNSKQIIKTISIIIAKTFQYQYSIGFMNNLFLHARTERPNNSVRYCVSKYLENETFQFADGTSAK